MILNCKITKKLKTVQYSKDIFLGKLSTDFARHKKGLHYVEYVELEKKLQFNCLEENGLIIILIIN